MRPVRGYCCVCQEPIYDSLDPNRQVECGSCVQKRVKHIERIELESGMSIKNREDYGVALKMARNNPTHPTRKRTKVPERGCNRLEWATDTIKCDRRKLPMSWEDLLL